VQHPALGSYTTPRDANVSTGMPSAKSLGGRPHEAMVQSRVEKRENDAVQACHRTISLLKRWRLGTHAGAVSDKHLRAYLDEFAFRHNRRKTDAIARIAARVIGQLVVRGQLVMKSLVKDTARSRWFASTPRNKPESSGWAYPARAAAFTQVHGK
jgi:hypothetical protein